VGIVLWDVVWDSVGHMRRLRLLATNADDGFLSLDAPVFMPRHKSSLKALHITPPFPNTHSYAEKNLEVLLKISFVYVLRQTSF